MYFRALRDRLHGVSANELPPRRDILTRLHLLLPIPAMIYLLVTWDSAFLVAAKTIVLIVMLKLTDLLASIPTRRSQTSWKPYLAISAVAGVLVYFFGLRIGGPFTWFVEDHIGIGSDDAGYWALFTFIVLKTAEIALLGRAGERAAVRTQSPGAIAVGEKTRSVQGLGDAFAELGRTVWISLEAGARNTLVVSCIAGVLGILLSAATQSDLPGRVSHLLVAASGGLLPVTIFWVIVAGYVVGMGLPIVASYVILAIFAVGTLTELGVPTLAAHMISYWVAVVSAVTPSVALAAYAASAVSGGDPIKTGNQALKLASMILVMPFLFVLHADPARQHAPRRRRYRRGLHPRRHRMGEISRRLRHRPQSALRTSDLAGGGCLPAVAGGGIRFRRSRRRSGSPLSCLRRRRGFGGRHVHLSALWPPDRLKLRILGARA